MPPTPVSANTRYFAYGANLSRAHMALWCPTAVPLAQAVLHDHRLVFRARADIVPSIGDTVQGCLYEVDAAAVAALDEFADCPALYGRARVSVLADGQTVDAMTYRMNPGHPLALPDPDYLNLILQGYRDWNLDLALLTVNTAGEVS